MKPPPLPATVDDAPMVRRVAWRDMPEMERHLLAFGLADRRKRFLWPAGDGAIVAYIARIDPEHAVVVGALHGDGRLLGVA